MCVAWLGGSNMIFGAPATTSVIETIPDVMPLANKLTSQEIILAVIVLLVSAGLFVVSLKFTYSILLKRDEVIKELGNKITDLNTCITKIIEVQHLDHAATIRNRDLLQEVFGCLTRIETCVGLATTGMKELSKDLQQHAKDCSRKLYGKEIP